MSKGFSFVIKSDSHNIKTGHTSIHYKCERISIMLSCLPKTLNFDELGNGDCYFRNCVNQGFFLSFFVTQNVEQLSINISLIASKTL